MPILNVKVSAKKSVELTNKIAATLLELTTRVLEKKPEVTSIAIDYVERLAIKVPSSSFAEA